MQDHIKSLFAKEQVYCALYVLALNHSVLEMRNNLSLFPAEEQMAGFYTSVVNER